MLEHTGDSLWAIIHYSFTACSTLRSIFLFLSHSHTLTLNAIYTITCVREIALVRNTQLNRFS